MNRYEAREVCKNLFNEQKDIKLEGYHDIDEDTFILWYSTKYEDIHLTIIPSKHDRESLIKYIINNKY